MNQLNVQWAGVDVHIECRVKTAGQIYMGALLRIGRRTAVIRTGSSLRSGDHVVLHVNDMIIPAEIVHSRGVDREVLLDREIDVTMLVGPSTGLFAPAASRHVAQIGWAA